MFSFSHMGEDSKLRVNDIIEEMKEELESSSVFHDSGSIRNNSTDQPRNFEESLRVNEPVKEEGDFPKLNDSSLSGQNKTKSRAGESGCLDTDPLARPSIGPLETKQSRANSTEGRFTPNDPPAKRVRLDKPVRTRRDELSQAFVARFAPNKLFPKPSNGSGPPSKTQSAFVKLNGKKTEEEFERATAQSLRNPIPFSKTHTAKFLTSAEKQKSNSSGDKFRILLQSIKDVKGAKTK